MTPKDEGAAGLSPSSRELLSQFKLSDQIYQQLFERIVSGEMPVDSRLPTEAHLTQQFGVSRPIVREALARLREDGLIASRQGSGSYVLRRPDQATVGFGPLNSIADIQRCYEFRAALEGPAAGLAAIRRQPDDIDRLRAALDGLSAAVKTGAVGVEADFEFHMSVVRASKNRFFLTTIESLTMQIGFGIRLARNLSLTIDDRLARVQSEHQAVFDAILAGDRERAERAMVTHITNARHRIFEGQPAAEALAL